MIGTEFCNITSLTSTQLLCVPPASQPPPNDADGDLPEVMVLVGSAGLRYRIGQVAIFNLLFMNIFIREYFLNRPNTAEEKK
jgi:hypothetical protein